MNITSHFLGLTLNNSFLTELFNSLKKYLLENHLEKVIELQNLNSLHITLYYFDKEINSSVLLEVKGSLEKLNKDISPIYINQVKFFQKKSKDYLCYLSPLEASKLSQINLNLKNEYPNTIKDNNYLYIPHLTIFKIKDFFTYKNHKENILFIINSHLEKIKIKNLSKKFNFYSVDSTHSPEKHKIIL